MNYEQKYNDTLDLARTFYEGYIIQGHDDEAGILAEIFPELKESKDARIRKQLLNWFKTAHWDAIEKGKLKRDDIIAWFEKQGEKPNPYSGVSFEYNGNIWGMCARDNGVDILLDKQLFKHLEKQDEKSINHTGIKEKAHQIAWETSKDYDPSLSKEAWCEMAALDMASWLEKQGEQKQTWKPSAAQLIVIKDLIEDKNTSNVNKTILRGMFDEFKQFLSPNSNTKANKL